MAWPQMLVPVYYYVVPFSVVAGSWVVNGCTEVVCGEEVESDVFH